jgi:rare lipoprotein A (peptidoglycan hydrolase)
MASIFISIMATCSQSKSNLSSRTKCGPCRGHQPDYTIGGRTYEPQENTSYSAEGLASWYGEDFHGRATANGEVYDMVSISAAHPTLPIPSSARFTNLANKKFIIVRVNGTPGRRFSKC